jgi:plasmid rolling circle replication initiator protein Rep
MSVIIQPCQKKGNNFFVEDLREKPEFGFPAVTEQWVERKKDSEAVAQILAASPAHQRKAQRIHACASVLLDTENADSETGEVKHSVYSNRLCHVRACPTCQWRHAVQIRAIFRHNLPALIEQHPKTGIICLTLTVKNCPVTDLRPTIKTMNSAWTRLMKRREFAKVKGWVRITEITKGQDGTAHPHFHCLLMVPSRHISCKGDYITNADWRLAWAEAMGIAYLPEVKNGAIRPPLKGSMAKVLNYIAKNPQSPDVQDPAYIVAQAEQIHQQRLFAAGGSLKGVLHGAGTSRPAEHNTNNIKRFQWDKSTSKYNILDNI